MYTFSVGTYTRVSPIPRGGDENSFVFLSLLEPVFSLVLPKLGYSKKAIGHALD